MRIRFWPNLIRGSAPQTKGDFWKSNEWIFDIIVKPSYLYSYFWLQTSPVSPRASDPSGQFSESSTSMVRLTSKIWIQKRRLLNYLKYSCNQLLKISLRFRYRAPDPVFFGARTGSSSLIYGCHLPDDPSNTSNY